MPGSRVADAALDGDGTPACGKSRSGLHYCCLFVVFLARLEVSVLTLAIPLIAREFGCSIELAAWVNLLPNFSSNMFMPAMGKFADMYGHALTWRNSLLMLGISTWLAAWSPSMSVLLVARALTGFAGSGIMNPTLPLMAKGTDKEQRGAIQSWISSIDALGSSTGVLFGGLLIDRTSWRMIFLIPAPFMTLMWFCSFHLVKAKPPATAGGKKATGPSSPHEGACDVEAGRSCPLAAFDWLGTLTFASGCFCLLFAINRVNDAGWDSPLVLGLSAGVVVLFPILACIEVRVQQPILPIWRFGTKERLLLTLTSCVTWSCYGSCFLLVPIYLQDALRMRPGMIGNLLAIRPIAASLMAATLSRLISRKAFEMRRLARVGSLVQVAAYGVLNVLARLRPCLAFYALLELQLVLQALGAFGTGLPANAMFVATLAEEELANITAMRGVMIGLLSLVVQTTNLSLIRMMGSEFRPECYWPTWIILVTLQLVVMACTTMIPGSAELGYSAAAQGDVDAPNHAEVKAEVVEVRQLDHDSDMPHAIGPVDVTVLGRPGEEERASDTGQNRQVPWPQAGRTAGSRPQLAVEELPLRLARDADEDAT